MITLPIWVFVIVCVLALPVVGFLLVLLLIGLIVLAETVYEFFMELRR